MSTKIHFSFAVALAAGALAASIAGCEIISTVDRSKISGSGGAVGVGGTGGIGGTGTGGTGTTCTTMTCTTETNCPSPSSGCVQRTCDMSCCGTANIADLTPTVAGQTAKDCKQVVCDGAGAEKVVDDDSDIPDGADACHLGVCMNGNQAQTVAPAGTSCAFDGGKVCDGNGACVECVMDADCTGEVCDPNTNMCVPMGCIDTMQNNNETDVDCGGADCSPCADGLKCIVDSDCQSQVCTGGICQAPTCSDGKKNGSETGPDCGGPCVALGGLCAFGEGCGDPTDCVTGACNGMTCIYKPQGTACSDPDECGPAGSNLCVDGFCCDTSCTNGCQACSSAKKGGGGNGVCGNVAMGNDPNNTCTDQGPCGDNGVCDGAGACQKYAAGTACGVMCTGATFTQLTCDATNACATSTMMACPGGLKCNAIGTVCLTACAADGDCVSASDYCMNPGAAGTCVAKKTNGQTCGTTNECTSGKCVDTVCCNADCTGTCQSCNVAGSAGMCIDVPSGGTDSTCAAPNVCDAGACVQCVSNMQCGAPAPTCNTMTHTCVSCLTGADCADGYCSPVTGTCPATLNGCTLATATDLTGVTTTSVTTSNAAGHTYSPPCIKVKVNTDITFSGANFGNHPLIGGEVNGGVGTPATSGPFIPVTSTGNTKIFTMSQTGVFPYYCTAHPGTAVGAVYVVP